MKRLAGFAGILIVWFGVAKFANSPFISSPDRVFLAMIGMISTGDLLKYAGASIVRVLVGFGISAVFGVTMGLAMYRSRLIRAALMPVVEATRPIGAITLYPLILFALGLGLWSKVFVIFWTAWPAVIINTFQSLRSVEKDSLEAARLDGADENEVMRYITIPLASSGIMTGLRLGLSAGWIAIVVAEMLGSNSGLGWAVITFSNSFMFPEMYAVIMTIALCGLGMNLLLAKAQAIFSYENGNDYEKRNKNTILAYNDRASGGIVSGMFSRREPGD